MIIQINVCSICIWNKTKNSMEHLKYININRIWNDIRYLIFTKYITDNYISSIYIVSIKYISIVKYVSTIIESLIIKTI